MLKQNLNRFAKKWKHSIEELLSLNNFIDEM